MDRSHLYYYQQRARLYYIIYYYFYYYCYYYKHYYDGVGLTRGGVSLGYTNQHQQQGVGLCGLT